MVLLLEKNVAYNFFDNGVLKSLELGVKNIDLLIHFLLVCFVYVYLNNWVKESK